MISFVLQSNGVREDYVVDFVLYSSLHGEFNACHLLKIHWPLIIVACGPI